MKKVMISQPMRGLTKKEIRKNREEVVSELTMGGYEVVDTIHPDFPLHLADKEKGVPIWYLGKSIEFMSGVDVVYFMSGWQEARGCKIEHQIANAYGLEVMEQDIKEA